MKKIILLLAAFLIMSCGSEEADEVTSSSWDQEGEYVPIAVEVLEVTKGQLVPFIEASGLIKGVREAWVISAAQGKISSFEADLGKDVVEGQVLLTVENDLQKLNRDLALQQYESSKLDFEALENSYRKGGISRSDFNSARTRLLQAETAYRSAQKAYDDTFLKTPFSGSIALIDESLAVGVTLSPGTPVALVIDRSSMKMDVSLGERQIGLIEAGQSAVVQISSGLKKEPINAFVSAIGTGSDTVTGSFPVQISWSEGIDDSMRSGISARVLMENSREEPVIIVPSSSIIVRNRKPSVILAVEGRAVVKEVLPGESLGGNTVIEEGLSVGDKLIVSALSSLGNGYYIEASEAGTTGDWR